MSFSDFWQLYLGFGLLVVLMTYIDLRWIHGKSGNVPFKQACIQSLLWICASLGFAAGLFAFLKSRELTAIPPGRAAFWTLQFLNVYVLEKCLSVDNLFVFVVIFRYFRIPPEYHHRVLYFGILGAFFFRGMFITLGTTLLSWQWVEIAFGIFLLWTAWQVARRPGIEYTPQKGLRHFLELRLHVTPDVKDERFFLRRPFRATPLLVALIFIETADIMFAVDSVPAALALSREPFIVFSANVWAILGLRSLYFVLTYLMAHLRYLHYGLGIVLGLVGFKMIFHNGTTDVGIAALYPLLIIVVVLGGTVLASWLAARRDIVPPNRDLS